MGANSSIEWTDATWNPVTGCTKVSQGCKHCYAEAVFPRSYSKDNVHEPPIMRPRRFTDVWTHPDRLELPLRWTRARRIFVNSMSDLFHEDVPDAFIDQVFGVMLMAAQHTFQILTKRPERMQRYMDSRDLQKPVAAAAKIAPKRPINAMAWPPDNVWLGVSVEDQATADERIPLLLQTPAAVRWISAEPLLAPIDLSAIRRTHAEGFMRPLDGRFNTLDWVVVGGESGRHGRPFDIAWARDIMAQCNAAGVPVLVKQLGVNPRWNGHANAEAPGWPAGTLQNDTGEGNWRPLLRDRKGGDMAEWPEDLRVRAYPT